MEYYLAVTISTTKRQKAGQMHASCHASMFLAFLCMTMSEVEDFIIFRLKNKTPDAKILKYSPS